MRFITATILLLGLAFYQLSGGNNFEPRSRQAQVVEVASDPVKTTQAPVFVAKTTDEIDVVKPRNSELRVIKASVKAQDPVKEMPSILMASLNTVTDAQDENVNSVASDAFAKEVRLVCANRANVRQGPGTNFSVIDRVERGIEVEILQDPGQGWVKFRNTETNRIGWTAASLLREKE